MCFWGKNSNFSETSSLVDSIPTFNLKLISAFAPKFAQLPQRVNSKPISTLVAAFMLSFTAGLTLDIKSDKESMVLHLPSATGMFELPEVCAELPSKLTDSLADHLLDDASGHFCPPRTSYVIRTSIGALLTY